MAEIHFGFEAGGTKCVCIAADGPENVLAERTIPTTTPHETLSAAQAFFANLGITPRGCGVATFGPAHVRPSDPLYGRLARTPKVGWDGADMLRVFAPFDAPKLCDTDVAGAALAEQRWGAGRGAATVAYVTVGTGIGVGVVQDGASIQGAWHLEVGHIRQPRQTADLFAGCCAFHGDCLEGLAGGPAILARWGHSLSELPLDHPAHGLEAHYLAQLCANLCFCYAPDVIVLGGGVMKTPGLLARVRSETERLLGGYAPWPAAADMTSLLRAPGLGDRAGPMGAIALAQRARLSSSSGAVDRS